MYERLDGTALLTLSFGQIDEREQIHHLHFKRYREA